MTANFPYNGVYQPMSFAIPAYQQPAAPQIPQPQQPQPQSNGQSFSWVNNEQEAKDFVVLPGNSVMLMSRNDPVFWIKATDQSGMPQPIRTFTYAERAQAHEIPVQQPQGPAMEYVTRQEYDELAARVEALANKKCACHEQSAETEETVNG